MPTSERTLSPITWALRAGWAVLPAGLGPALGDALAGWGDAPRTLAESMLWGAWGLGLVAVLSPRPWALTVARAGAAAAFAAALAAVFTVFPDGEGDVLAVAGALLTTGLVAAAAPAPEVAVDFVNGTAYGDERRLVLRHPRVVGMALAPASALTVAAALAAGPLLLADGRLVAGVPVLAAGPAVVALLARSLHALSRRWLVFVPGGVVLHDPLVLADPVLLPRGHLRRIDVTGSTQAPAGATDLRLGARGGEIVIDLNEAVPLLLARRGGVERVSASQVVVSLARPGAALAEATRRQFPVGQVAMPPPRTSSSR